jgi:hypothetical protein
VQSASRTPWWLWPNLLNLDSPLLAVIWQEQFARVTGVSLEWGDRVLLFCCTWLVYCADRTLDAAESGGKTETARHAIQLRGKPIWLGVSAAVLVVAIVLAAMTLNSRAWLGGGVVLGFTAIHFGATHWWLGMRSRFWPKEWHVGFVFSVGCALQVWSLSPSAWPSLLLPVIGFGALCAMSCSHITAWEVVTVDRDDPGSLLNAHPMFVRRLSWFDIALGLSAMAVAAALGQAAVQFALLSVGISAFGLAWLHDRCDRFSTDFLRVTADFGLYTPLLFFVFSG